MAAYIYNALLLNRIQHDMEKILRRNQDGFRKGCSTIGQILTVRRVIKGIKARQVPVTLLFVDFSKGFESFHREKMEKNSIRLRNTQRNCHSHNDPVQEHKINGQIPRWRHRIFQYFRRGTSRRCIGTIFVRRLYLDCVLRISVD